VVQGHMTTMLLFPVKKTNQLGKSVHKRRTERLAGGAHLIIWQ